MALIISVKENMKTNRLNFKWTFSDFSSLSKVPNRISVMILCCLS